MTNKVTKCKFCKRKFTPPGRGRKPTYCSQACRQKAYRKRQADPHRPALKAFTSDLYSIRDRTARARAAVKVLEELGWIVTIERRQGPPPKQRQPYLELVKSADDADDDELADPPSPKKPQ